MERRRQEVVMRALVVYESMYGNTHTIASAIGRGLESGTEVVPVTSFSPEMLQDVDLLVAGGPTHVHGMSRPATRQSAVDSAGKPDSRLVMDPGAAGEGVREWLESLGELDVQAAAFDTRADLPVLLSGRAATGITKALRRHGVEVIAEPESFLVTKQGELLPGEQERAEEWGAALRRTMDKDRRVNTGRTGSHPQGASR
jgi:hypothetical protein